MKPELRPISNSLANLLYNLLGWIPAPVLYGIVSEQTGGKKSRWGMFMTFAVNVLVLLFITITKLTMPNLKTHW